MRKVFISGLIIVTALSTTACKSNVKFDGERTGNDSEFILEYEMFNGSDSQDLKLQKGDSLEVDVLNDGGTLNMDIVKKDDGETLYEGENLRTSYFEIKAPEDGIYEVTVEGEKAVGEVTVERIEREEESNSDGYVVFSEENMPKAAVKIVEKAMGIMDLEKNDQAEMIIKNGEDTKVIVYKNGNRDEAKEIKISNKVVNGAEGKYLIKMNNPKEKGGVTIERIE